MKPVALAKTTPLQHIPGVRMRPFFGEGLMFDYVEFDPDAAAPLHDHPSEQLIFVIEGSLTLSIEGIDQELGPGDALDLPGGVKHGGRAGSSGCVLISAYHPIREDLRELVAQKAG